VILTAAAGAVAAAGLLLMAQGARREAAGRLDEARGLGRQGGFVAAAGAVAVAAISPMSWSSAFAVASGAIALLGGLAGKPRPAWWIAAIALGLAGLGYTFRPP
jgi:hypothetical protein